MRPKPPAPHRDEAVSPHGPTAGNIVAPAGVQDARYTPVPSDDVVRDDDRELWRATRARLEHALAGTYLIQRQIAAGSAAAVFVALDLRHDRHVAIKVLHPSVAGDLQTQRFLREIDIATRLEHPHIVPLYDSGDVDGLLYYVMRYVQGASLAERLARERQLPVSTALSIARNIADALDHAHRSGIVHRDIKPDNILLDGDTAIVTDFGVARAIHEATSSRLTATGVGIGTPAYMSPEQAGGDAQIDARSDVYALGCVVYEMLAGEPPFSGHTPQALVAKHMHAPVPKLDVVRPTVSRATQSVLEQALAKIPADRFSTAGAFVDALERSVHTEENSATVRPGTRALIIGGAATMLLAVAGTWAVLASRPGFDAPRAPGVDVPRVAVLYFDDLTPDSTLRHVADGLTEELIDELSGVNAFRVVSKRGVRPYRARLVRFDSIVSALHVDIVIDGSVQTVGDRLRVSVKFIDARSDTYLDGFSLEQSPNNLIDIERDVAERIAAELRRHVGREVRLRGIMSGTSIAAARELELKAQRARDDATELAGSPHPNDLRAAVATLTRADSLLRLAQLADTTWVRPTIDRGWVARQLAEFQSGKSRVAALSEGLRFAEAALRREPHNPRALELRGTLNWLLVTEHEAATPDSTRVARAEADLRRAVGMDSTLANAWATLSFLLQIKGSFAEAALVARRALEEDPFLANARDVYDQLFYSLLMASDFPSAAQWCRRGRTAFPQDWRFIQCDLTLLRHDVSRRPDPESAWVLVRLLERVDPHDVAVAAGRPYQPIYRRMVAAAISARAGHHTIARTELARAIAATKNDASLRLDLAYDEAYLRLMLGERKKAEELLRHLEDARPVLRPLLARDPLFRDLRLLNRHAVR